MLSFRRLLDERLAPPGDDVMARQTHTFRMRGMTSSSDGGDGLPNVAENEVVSSVPVALAGASRLVQIDIHLDLLQTN